MSERTVYSMDERMDRATTAALLRGIAADLAAGDDLRLGEGDEATSVGLPDSLGVEVELEVDGDEDETELEIEFEWPGSDVHTGEAVSAEDRVSTTTPATETGGADGAEATDADGAAGTGSAVEDPIEPVEPGDLPSEAVPAPDAAPPVSLARFELYRDRGDEWRWRLVHRNGNIVATSGEGYSSDRAARRGMQSVMRNAPGAAVLRDE